MIHCFNSLCPTVVTDIVNATICELLVCNSYVLWHNHTSVSCSGTFRDMNCKLTVCSRWIKIGNGQD